MAQILVNEMTQNASTVYTVYISLMMKMQVIWLLINLLIALP